MALSRPVSAAGFGSVTTEAPLTDTSHDRENFRFLFLAALGTVYGDIGTSPLYAVREAFGETGRLPLRAAGVMGVLSLMFWALILIVTLKYVLVVLRADNHGEGGVVALSALAHDKLGSRGAQATVVILAMIGTGLFFGDGVITPSISLLGAIEGLEVAAPALRHLVVPLALVILIGLFMVQRRGTAVVGKMFGPVMLVWFAAIALLGVVEIAQQPSILKALSPYYAVRLFQEHHWSVFIALAAVVLVVTGGEALYADLGHFGRRPIQWAWLSLVLPALVLNYFGQGALLLRDPRALENPFYLLAPSWAWYPLLGLATLATVIASQAVISGAFSLTRQAVNLGYLPRMEIRHTSAQEIGQVYVPQVNWLLMVVVGLTVIGFGSSSAIAGAYGIAVTGTMIITTALAYIVARRLWGWRRGLAMGVFGLFGLVDFAFFSSNLLKIPQGGWFPLGLGAFAVLIMATWRKGRRSLLERRGQAASSLSEFVTWITRGSVSRIPGTAVFLSANGEIVPSALLHNLKHNRVLHERVIILTIRTEEVPRVDAADRLTVERLDGGFHVLVARYGFTETPDVPRLLAGCRGCGAPFDVMQTSFFLSREKLIAAPGHDLNAVEERVFIALSHVAQDATEFFRIPTDRVIEVGTQIEV